jgi:hypothetical protein
VAEFIKADDGSYINVDHIFDLVPANGGAYYVAHYPGVNEDGEPACAFISAAVVRHLVTSSAKQPARKTRD